MRLGGEVGGDDEDDEDGEVERLGTGVEFSIEVGLGVTRTGIWGWAWTGLQGCRWGSGALRWLGRLGMRPDSALWMQLAWVGGRGNCNTHSFEIKSEINDS